ncbi:MAG TPA: SDR family oxidoreductase [Luteibaculaceae bacterium]|nr:SDR family oxidoreductase [Luteibaculaceae bacterium]
MKIALFGATGALGSEVLHQAVASGLEVVALVREPNKIKTNHPLLNVVKGDVLIQDDVNKVISGVDAVVSCFGHSFSQLKASPAGLQTEGTRNILRAMHLAGVKRIISLSGGALPFPSHDKPKMVDRLARFIMSKLVPKVINDAQDHAELLEKSNLDWTIVRGARFSDGPFTGNYNVAWVGVDSGLKIGRPDLAHAILRILKEGTYLRQMPFVSQK